ncbi:hypothetical protein KAR91_66060 [Candidatus Pacearchaeota archaeon]|nr:hypothetical protein [Candidatus Pacearchaeota archaeon]
MVMIQQHFAKYLEKSIWNYLTEKKVILKGVRSDFLQYQNGKTEEKNGNYTDFKILVNDEEEMIRNEIPIELAVVELETTTVRKPLTLTPEIFLDTIKNIIYKPLNVTHELMVKKRKSRKREYVEARQVIMSVYYCAFDQHKTFKLSLATAGGIYTKDHATVKHAIEAVNDSLDTDSSFREKYIKVWNLVKIINPHSKLHI